MRTGTEEFVVRANIGGRSVADFGLIVKGRGKARAVTTFTGDGDPIAFPLNGRRAADVAAQVGLLNLQRDFSGPLTSYTVERHDSGKVVQAIVKTAMDFRGMSAATFFEVAQDRVSRG